MGKNKGKQNRKARRASKFANHNFSRLQQHQQTGTALLPPFARLPNAVPTSWADDHMPEMLWAVLLTETFERRQYLECFRRLAVLCREWFLRRDDEANQEKPGPVGSDGINFTIVADLTTLSGIPEDEFRKFVGIITTFPLGYAALRPLLLLECLPGRARWEQALALAPTEEDWTCLGSAVAHVLDHQSERSTDIRWFKLLLPIIAGRMYFPESARDDLESLRLFPNHGDMRSVRPFIRSGEVTLRRNPPSPWVTQFWAELLAKTKCIDGSTQKEYTPPPRAVDRDSLYKVRANVIGRFLSVMTPDRADAKLDTAFGFVLYALALIEEIGAHQLQGSIVGRIALRSLVEVAITFRYLATKDDRTLWKSFRVFGSGQAKLAFLKAQEKVGELPKFLDEEGLHAICNEDIWQEFLPIDVGHWTKSNLRRMAQECGAKDLYDRYYDWTSTFAHGHWGAIRDSNYLSCHNPLHRLHRIPRQVHRALNPVDIDAIEISNAMLVTLDNLFPGSAPIGSLAVAQPPARSKATSTGASVPSESPQNEASGAQEG